MQQSKFLFLLITVLFIQCKPNENIKDHLWPDVKPENKPGTYWWWMGSAVDKENLTYNLESLAEAGIGKVHVIPIYGVKGEEHRYIDFLNPKWMDMLDFTVKEANTTRETKSPVFTCTEPLQYITIITQTEKLSARNVMISLFCV